jgi:hypothetical protein
MSKIIALSKYGFKLDTSDIWYKGDSKFLLSEGFKSLSKGITLKGLETNKCGFVTSVTVLTHKDKGEEVIKSQITSLNVCSRNVNSGCKASLPSSASLGVDVLERDKGKVLDTSVSKPLSVQDNIRYAQCVNIAFENQSLCNVNLMYDGDNKWAQRRIEETFDVADKIYIEFNKRVGGM